MNAQTATDGRRRPNILFIWVDQLSACWTGCYGSSVVKTPNIDRLASQGVLFERAYTTSPLCTPHRAVLMTGLYPSQTGVVRLNRPLPQNRWTLAQAFNDAGYGAWYLGKWHLAGRCPECPPPDAPHPSFHGVPPEKRGGFRHFLGWEAGHVDHWNGVIWGDDPHAPIRLAGHETDGLTDMAIDMLARAGGDDKPFCMFVSYQAPHPPCSPPEQYAAMYADPRGLLERPSTDPDAVNTYNALKRNLTTPQFRRDYFGEITHLDAAIGRLLAALDADGRADDTIVVFTSDHGEMAGCHGRFNKSVMYEESTAVPLLVRLPGRRGQRRIDAPVATVDLTTTLLGLAGIDRPEALPGRDLTPAMRNGTAIAPSRLFLEEHAAAHQLGVVDGSVKLVVNARTLQPIAMYDLKADPYEMTDVRQDPARRDQAADLLDYTLATYRRLKTSNAS